MKKAWLFTLFLCLIGLCSIITAQEKSQNTKTILSRTNAARNELKKLLEAGYYDSAISICAGARQKNNLSYDDQEKILATAYWYKGDKNTAYQYVLNYADYELKLTGGAGAPFGMLDDYAYALPLATDTFLEQIIINKVTAFYDNMDYYPDAPTGLKLMLSDYKYQKLIRKQEFELDTCTSLVCKQALTIKHAEERANIDPYLVALIKNKNRLYNVREVGPAYNKQPSIIAHLPEIEDHLQLQPILYKAMVSKDITADAYVNELITIEQLQGRAPDLQKMKDSLCEVYHCNKILIDSLIKKMVLKNDSTIFIQTDSFTIIDK